MVVNNINIFLKQKKVKGLSMNVNAIEISLKMKNKGQLDTKKLSYDTKKKRLDTIFSGEYITPFKSLWINF